MAKAKPLPRVSPLARLAELDQKIQRQRAADSPLEMIHGVRVGTADINIDTPSHTPGTQRGEELVQRHEEKGRTGPPRTARSSTSINAKLHGPVDPRMPHLPPA